MESILKVFMIFVHTKVDLRQPEVKIQVHPLFQTLINKIIATLRIHVQLVQSDE